MSAIWGPPANLRLVVTDTETTLDDDRKRRAVAIGLVACSGKAGALSQKTSCLVNPGCTIDEKSQEKHHVSDDDVADQPPFADAWPVIAAHLKPRKGETVVVVAHHAAFDLSLLRDEIARTGAKPALPDLPVFDTMKGLLDASGLETDRRDLQTVAAACGVPFSDDQHHDALGDAVATARIARVLLDRAAAAGHADIGAILVAATGGRTTTMTPPAVSGPESEEPEAPAVPDAHLALHAADFPRRPTDAVRARWTALFTACAALRCPEMAAPDGIPAPEKRRLLFAVLASAAARGDATAVATVLGPLNPLLASLRDNIASLRVETGAVLPRIAGRRSDRGVAVVLWLYLEQLLAGVGRCPESLPCPACRDGLPCPRDTWPQALAVFVMPEPTEKTATAFWNPRGQAQSDERGKGSGRGWASMRADAPTLADAVLRRCLEFYRAEGKFDSVDDVVDQVWREGCRDPGVTAFHASKTATGGRPVDLVAAAMECRETLALRDGNTDRAWDHLSVLAAMLDGRLARSLVPPAARHAAVNPRRPARKPRFLRQGAVTEAHSPG